MLKVFGPRVAIQPVTEEYKGLVVLPPGVGRNNHAIGKVISIGDGKMPDGKPPFETELKVDDIVMFQVNDYMMQATQFAYNKETCLNLHQGDMIAKLSAREIKLKTFEIIGRWALVQPFTSRAVESRIVLPQNLENTSEFQRFRLVQQGSRARLDAVEGDELIIDKGKLNVLQIDGTTLFYVDNNAVLGVVFESTIVTP
jgi:co-chaperonin GroES (HSP10)